MAFPQFNAGFFQVTALSFSPSVVAIGETATMSITIKNVSGKNVTKCYVDLDGSYPSRASSYGGMFPHQFLYGGGGSSGYDFKTISWGNNVSHTFTATITFSESANRPVDPTNYVLPAATAFLFINIVTNAEFSDGSNADGVRIRSGDGYLAILPVRDNPRLSLEIERTPDDESTSVKTTSTLTSDTTASKLAAHNYSIAFYATNAHNPALPTDTEVNFNATIADLIEGITDSTTAITETFSNGTDWYFLMVVSNGYETASAYGSISQAFANLHLSGTGAGVAIGKFSASEPGSPLFEVNYPAVFYDDVSVAENGLFRWLTFNGTFSSSSTSTHSLSGTLTNPDYATLRAAGYRILAIASFGSGGTNWYVRQISHNDSGITMNLTYRSGDVSKPSISPWAYVCLVKMIP